MELDKLTLKFIWKNKNAKMTRKTGKRKVYEGKLTLSVMKIHYKSGLFIYSWYW